MSVANGLPPGPRMPRWLQTIGWWSRPTAFLETCRRAHGTPFVIDMVGQEPFVMIADPGEVKQVFTAPPEVLHPGEGARILEPIIGPNSVILLDERPHLVQRKLVLPAFHGERMAALSGVVEEVAREQIADWPTGRSLPLHSRMQELTLEVILHAVFGIRSGRRLSELRGLLARMLDFGRSPLSLLPPAQRAPFGRGPWGEFLRTRERVDALIGEEIAERREAGEDREDVLSILLEARHDDGSPMSERELRDELMTLLVAGHETTATELSWALERLGRDARVRTRLVEEIGAGEERAYLRATVRETLRRRPVLTIAAPRKVKREIEVGGRAYPAGVSLCACIHLVHHDPDIYPDPYEFRPERFLEQEPGTYTWIPFGGGRRRCIGASFAQLEMEIVLHELLRRYEVEARAGRFELARRRAITVSPAAGAETVLTPR